MRTFRVCLVLFLLLISFSVLTGTVSARLVTQNGNSLTPFFVSSTPGPTQTPTPTIDPTIFALTPAASPSARSDTQQGITLFLYIILAAVFIMVIHFAMAIGNQFNLFLMSSLFIFSGIIGWWMHSYEGALVLGIILSLLFW